MRSDTIARRMNSPACSPARCTRTRRSAGAEEAGGRHVGARPPGEPEDDDDVKTASTRHAHRADKQRDGCERADARCDANRRSVDRRDHSVDAALDPELQAKLARVMSRMRDETGHDVKVAETYRSQDRQDTLFAQGRETPGTGRHVDAELEAHAGSRGRSRARRRHRWSRCVHRRCSASPAKKDCARSARGIQAISSCRAANVAANGDDRRSTM